MRLLTVIAVATLLAGCNTSYNYFEDDRSGMPDGGNETAFGAILGLTGVVAPKRPPIEYETRAPLALPPGRDLPEPSAGEPPAPEGVAWPDDPDVAERERLRARAAAGAEQAAYDNDLSESQQARLSPEDIQAGRLEGGGLARRDDKIDSNRPQQFRLSPRDLAKTIPGLGSRNAELITEDGEVKPRRYLVEPPEAYRRPSESAPLPAPGEVENSEWAKKRLYRQDQRKPPRLVK